MKVEGPSAAHIRHVAERMRAKDAEEFLAVSFAENRNELVEVLVSRYADHPGVFCFNIDNGAPTAVGALVEGRPRIATLLFFATDDFGQIALPLARFIKRNIFPRYRALGFHRFECISVDGYDEVHRWIELVGLKREGAFEKYGKGGETFVQFAQVT